MTTARTDRQKRPLSFCEAEVRMSEAAARATIEAGLATWHAPTLAEARRRHAAILTEFPDDYSPDVYWSSGSDHRFGDFFSWGHDHDFGHGVVRPGAMGPRHVEILAECVRHGFLPQDMHGLDVLDVGCWSGGDVLALAGLGAGVTAIEEHARSAASAQRLCALVGCPALFVGDSLYHDRRDWRQRFDRIYAGGVIYHVTDPLLFVRILFAYLKVGGSLVLETKAIDGPDSACGYSGTVERGWNWFAPNREALGRWLVDGGFAAEAVTLKTRDNGRLLAAAVKREPAALPEPAGFSRPGSWLEGVV